MASDIEIVNISNFEKIQNFLNDSAYKEILENSENFNTRLCIERRLRMPFLDPQTGVAQTHCALFMKQKQRMPGFRDGQIYTYPSARWRKPKRQYLLHHQSYKAYQFRESQTHNHHHYHSTQQSQQQPSSQQQQQQQSQQQSSSDNSAASAIQPDGNSLGASGDNDSKDGHPTGEKEWFYEDMELTHVEEFEEDFDSDADFDDSYSNRKRKRAKPAKKPPANPDATPKRGRKGGRRKADGETKRRSNAASASSASFNTNSCASPLNSLDDQPLSMLTSADKMPSDEAEPSPKKGNSTGGGGSGGVGGGGSGSGGGSAASKMRTERDTTAHPSPYCDFCLGDAKENKKTNLPEELVSCSDCGRSGHPTCLQFTPNMIISVKRYRWQCIECKYCSICGTSDNDDQLLFCDDCDRGYHMYCLSPPLITPPEGSWSCKLCLEEFHSGGVGGGGGGGSGGEK